MHEPWMIAVNFTLPAPSVQRTSRLTRRFISQLAWNHHLLRYPISRARHVFPQRRHEAGGAADIDVALGMRARMEDCVRNIVRRINRWWNIRLAICVVSGVVRKRRVDRR